MAQLALIIGLFFATVVAVGVGDRRCGCPTPS